MNIDGTEYRLVYYLRHPTEHVRTGFLPTSINADPCLES